MKYTAIVLAAQRHKVADPLHALTQGGHKCLLDIHGQPMISWVLRSLLQTEQIERVVVSIEDARVLAELSGFERERESGRLLIETSASNLFSSVAQALGGDGAPRCPALITTADNPLLSPEILNYFIQQIDSDTEVAVAMTRADVMREKYPDGQRRFYQFKNGEYSNCNLYAITRAEALGSARIFAQGGQFGKKAIRMLRAFGVVNFLLYRLGSLSLESCARRLSRGFAANIRFIELPFAEAPIDVDNERTLKIAREIIHTRLSQRAA